MLLHRLRHPATYTLALYACLAFAGCQNNSTDSAGTATESETARETSSAESSSDDAKDSAAASIELVKVTPEEFQERVAQHQGKVVLVDFWATWCEPCKEQFPHTVQFAAKYANDLHVISVSADDPEDPAGVEEFLSQQRATEMENLLTALDLEDTFDQFDVRGGIPFYKLYDREGKLRYEFNGNPQRDDNTEPIDQLEVRLKELIDEQ